VRTDELRRPSFSQYHLVFPSDPVLFCPFLMVFSLPSWCLRRTADRSYVAITTLSLLPLLVDKGFCPSRHLSVPFLSFASIIDLTSVLLLCPGALHFLSAAACLPPLDTSSGSRVHWSGLSRLDPSFFSLSSCVLSLTRGLVGIPGHEKPVAVVTLCVGRPLLSLPLPYPSTPLPRCDRFSARPFFARGCTTAGYHLFVLTRPRSLSLVWPR